MVKIIKTMSSGLAPTMRSGVHERVAASWGVDVDGVIVARIFEICGTPCVVAGDSGRVLYRVDFAPRRKHKVKIAKEWAINHFNGVVA